MNPEPTLLPIPRHIDRKSGSFSLQPGKLIQFLTSEIKDNLLAPQLLSQAIELHSQLSWQLTASQSISEDTIGVVLSIDNQLTTSHQGYHLMITPQVIKILGKDLPGLFYGIQTLIQIIKQSQENRLSCLEIRDWPDYQTRGVLLDISRDKVYCMETLFMLIDEMASWKVNQLQLYTEHTFSYQGHEVVWQNASPITPQEILALDQYCSERFIELVPNQNSFGHMTRWLKHPEYQHLAETIQPIETPWGHLQKEPFSLAPTLPETLTFISGLFDQLLPNFSSKMINVGCDETFDIGMGKSREACEDKGKGEVYLDYLLSLHWDLSRRGYQMQFWGDIILNHPELVSQLPGDVIALDWGYESDHPFADETAIFQQHQVPFYVCPGTSSWNSIAGRVDNMLANCQQAAQTGLDNGAVGYLLTDWGDNGHWQQLPISYPGFIAGSAFSWCLSSNQKINLSETMNNIIFNDHSKRLGDILVSIGNEYRTWGLNLPNSSPLFWLLHEERNAFKNYPIEARETIHESIERLQGNLKSLATTMLHRPDALTIKKEVGFTIQLMLHASRRALTLYDSHQKIDRNLMLHEILELKASFKSLWLTRNRIGGLFDSLSRFDTLINEYSSRNGKS